MTKEDFIKEIAAYAQRVYQNHHILASLIIAQGCLESAWGTSGLATKGHNLFGMKGEYKGQYVTMMTWEVINGENVQVPAKFRKYPSWKESIDDLANLYLNGVSWDKNHYRAVVGETDYQKATAALVKAGYATDPNYATKLNSIIFTYKLTKYDTTEGLPDNPDEPSNPDPIVDLPSKEYDGKDITLNQSLPKDVYLPKLHVASQDDSQAIEVIGADPDLLDDTTGKKDIEFTITRTADNGTEYDLLVNDNILYLDEKKYNHQKYFITDIAINQEGTLSKKVTASHVYVVTLNNHYVEDTISGTFTVRKMLDFVFEGTKLRYIFMDKETKFSSVEQENFGDRFGNDLMDEIVEDYGLELDVDNYKVYVYKKMGKRINHTLDTRYNMPGITIKTSTQGCSTRARGFGAIKENSSTDSKKTEYVFEPVLYKHPDEDKFLIDGMPRWAEPLRDEKYKKASSMLVALKKYVNPYPQTEIEVDYEYIYEPKLLKIQEDFWKGDTLHILADTSYGVTYEDDVRLLAIQYKPLNPYAKPTLTFANFRKDIQDIRMEQEKRLKDQKRYMQKLRMMI
ncbi:Phage minor structural protein [Bacillus subtilis]|uniref:phage tail spike protein n=1 Tax=Bacillus subtilis TaxID=1423 RepID=UPI001B9EBAA9|nr:phage tail spike protein [Bacillus subtilis]CAF1783787.1 Exo-glucosaminidase LytG [Bacillus subtilis]CAI6266448.1 Phage minor structural protein [Bacillus subtilis]